MFNFLRRQQWYHLFGCEAYANRAITAQSWDYLVYLRDLAVHKDHLPHHLMTSQSALEWWRHLLTVKLHKMFTWWYQWSLCKFADSCARTSRHCSSKLCSHNEACMLFSHILSQTHDGFLLSTGMGGCCSPDILLSRVFMGYNHNFWQLQ